MADFSFNDDETASYTTPDAHETSFITGLIVRTGIAKSERSATIMLAGLALVLIVIAALFWFSHRPNTNATPASEILRQAQQPQHLP
jgi:hypothetical protein